jgi:hypothetical protein
VLASSQAGTRCATGRPEDLAAIDTFYAEVLQSLKAWAAKPPRMREQTDTSELARDQEVPPALVATALSSQDGPNPEEADSVPAGGAQ